MDPYEIIKIAIINYDLITINMLPYFNRYKSTIYNDIIADTERNMIKLYDINTDKEVYKGHYEYIGKYINNTFLWAWADPALLKNQSYIARMMLNYALDIDVKDYFIKGVLLQSIYHKCSKIQLELIISLSLYLTKKKGYFNVDGSIIFLLDPIAK